MGADWRGLRWGMPTRENNWWMARGAGLFLEGILGRPPGFADALSWALSGELDPWSGGVRTQARLAAMVASVASGASLESEHLDHWEEG